MTREEAIKKLKEQPAQVYIDKTDYQQGYIDGVNQMVKELKAEQQKPIECEDAISRAAVTNGEVIKKTFPHYDIEIDEHKGYVRVFYEDFYTTYPWKWWNAKYKGDMPLVQPSRKVIEDIENEIKTEMQDYDGQKDEFSMGLRCGLRKAIGFIGKYIGGVE